MSRGTDVVLAIDSSTTSCKVLAITKDGEVIAAARRSLRLDNPGADAWEQDAEQWWETLVASCREVTDAVGSRASVRALCIAHQRETFVVTDDAGVPLHPALVWMDGRATPQVERAIASHGASYLHRVSGKPPNRTPSLYKLMFFWEVLAPHLVGPDGRVTDATRVLDVHGFLTARLIGEMVTSIASADPMGLVDMAERDWSERLLSLASLSRRNVARLVPPGTVMGEVVPAVARRIGVPSGTPLVAGAGDGQAAGLGAGVFEPGTAYLNVGTAVVSGVLSHTYRCDRAFRTLFGPLAETYFLETDLLGGTFTVNWLTEFLGAHGDAAQSRLAQLEVEAATLPPGADGLLLLPYWSGVMNPYWDDKASGAIVGLKGEHGPAHVYRAILEGIGLEHRLHTRGVEAAVGAIHRTIAMGGGAQRDLWCQILADTLDRPIHRTVEAEATALGAGILAAAAVGMHPSVEAASSAMTRISLVAEPSSDAFRYTQLFDEIYEGLYASLKEAMAGLAAFRNLP